ncbi:membrane protein [Modestobacter caceresii]|uniref:Membrane protein n=1 Tax=Modestobacter caceresii TaxID=1522368 RepID=A0A098Y674_9ACTN|nr:membrane protein [Modestobacter caceresii]KGH45999.1 membrane protein [Modestobacter caceresii]
MLLIDPMPLDRRPTRAVLLLAGLLLYGFSSGLMLQAGLGQMPWAVLHQGLSRSFGLSIGTWTILVGALVLLAWVPLRLRPGVGTVGNVLVLGVALDATLALVPAPTTLSVRVPLLLVGILLNGIATGAYIGAGLGAGPRDGLSTGLAARGMSLRVVRTTIEVGVLATGWALGGNVGVGTVLYALGIGPLVHRTLPAFRLRDGSGTPAAVTRVPALPND